MVAALTLLVFGLSQVPADELLPGYVAAYLLIGACIFLPLQTFPSLRQTVAFLLPGALLVIVVWLDVGFWAGGWLLGLPAWGLQLSRWTRGNPLQLVQLLKFLGLLVLGLVVFTFTAIFPPFSLGLFALPIIPFLRLAFPEYRARPLQAAVEVLLGLAVVVVAFAMPTPEGSWSSSWVHAGGASTAGLMIAFGTGAFRRSVPLQLNKGAIA